MPPAHRLRVAGGMMSARSAGCDPLKLVERTQEAFASKEDTEHEEIRQTLLSVRRQYDHIRHEAEQKEARLKQIREKLREADGANNCNSEEVQDYNEEKGSLEMQLKDTLARLEDTQLSRKVYEHMLSRMKREQAILKQKMLKMEGYLGRKTRDVEQKRNDAERARSERVTREDQLAAYENETDREQWAFAEATKVMHEELEARWNTNKQKSQFDEWRFHVALEAANTAFNDSAGRLRKMCAIEKLASNQLQKTTIEQETHSQKTEDGFQKIREVTGLTDVMDIVHKFLNRDHEHEELKQSVKKAEVELEALRQELEAVKGQTEGVAFQPSSGGEGEVYKAREDAECELEQAMEQHQAARVRLQRNTLQVEHLKRWTVRVGQLLSSVEEPHKVDATADLKPFFEKFEATVTKFMKRVSQQIGEGKITMKVLKDFNDQVARQSLQDMLSDQGSQSVNRRVPPTDDPRSNSRQEPTGEDDPDTQFRLDRIAARERERLFVQGHQKSKAKEDKETRRKRQ